MQKYERLFRENTVKMRIDLYMIRNLDSPHRHERRFFTGVIDSHSNESKTCYVTEITLKAFLRVFIPFLKYLVYY